MCTSPKLFLKYECLIVGCDHTIVRISAWLRSCQSVVFLDVGSIVACPPCDQQLQTLCDVAHLALGVEDQAAAAGQVGAGPVHAEEVRVVRASVMPRYADGRSPQRSLRTSPSRPRIVIGHNSLVCSKSGGVHDDVGRIAGAVLGDDRVGFDVVDAGPDQFDVVAGQRAAASCRCPAGCACRSPGSRAPPWPAGPDRRRPGW